MLNYFNNKTVLKDVFYNNNRKLQTRIDFWNEFGTNNLNYKDFLFSLIDDKFDNYADLGCGNAFYSSLFLPYVQKKAYFCDISEKMLQKAYENIKKNNFSKNINYYLLNEDVCETSIPSSSCQLITMMHVLHHVDNIYSALNEAKRIVSPNGYIIVTTYNHNLKDWLNAIHYKTIEELGFPKYMLDKPAYLKFSGNNAFDILKRVFPTVIKKEYINNAIVNDVESVMMYYKSAMMYRLSKGPYTKDIDVCQWQKLYEKVKEHVCTKIEKDGVIEVDGKVSAFKIYR